MIKIEDKSLAFGIKQGIATKDEVVAYLIKNCNIWELADAAAEWLLQVPEKQITINQDELDRIISLFKVRGLREGSNGNYVRETRGRKKITNKDL